jgi:hypothetical protein
VRRNNACNNPKGFFKAGFLTTPIRLPHYCRRQYGAARARSLAALARPLRCHVAVAKLDGLTFVLGPGSCGENRIALSSRQWRTLRIKDVKQSFLQMGITHNRRPSTPSLSLDFFN